ncbi:cytochrome P450 [Roseovarius sp. SCSIO 43702]|uniref:cytochrome P450 n=1 Tax=Roseovarius sp. SCSIO 43702 TaxID=2823043 RepID=UPI001C72F661|nr:cytochrome P450 [Roseovarius sp. SCSIO 43702]QYX57177.1 cytochrome P450 [Roseovarius sp. SCSIO 43702]
MSDTLPFLDLSDPALSTRGPEVVAARDANWCARTPYGLAVLRWREVGLILRDRRFRQGSHAWPDTVGISGPFAEFWKASVIGQEGETHARMRALAVPALSEDYVLGLVPTFDAIAAELCAELRRTDRCEFQSAFATPFAGQAIAALLGLDRARWPDVAHDATELGHAMSIRAPSFEDRTNAACTRLFALADTLVARVRRGEDSKSYVARLVARFDETGDCSHDELLNVIVISIFGGVDTTRALLGLGLSLFIEHPEQWQIMRRDPDLVPAAIDEIIRARPTTTWATREATEDVELSGIRVEKGTILHLLVHASARDPAICDDPRFDITKPRKRHFGFGGGAHHCIGHFVARTDLAAAFRALSATLAKVDHDGPPEWLPDSGNTGAVSLPIRYELAAQAPEGARKG